MTRIQLPVAVAAGEQFPPALARGRPSVPERPGMPGTGVNSPVAAIGSAEGAAHRHALQAGRRLALATGIVASHEPPAPSPLGGEGLAVVR
jgi:hypothetical protein